MNQKQEQARSHPCLSVANQKIILVTDNHAAGGARFGGSSDSSSTEPSVCRCDSICLITAGSSMLGILFISGFVPALIFGMLIGNLLQGLPFHLDENMRIVYEGSLAGLFNPFAFWCGLTSVFMLVMHGGFYLSIKTAKPLSTRALFWAKISVLLLIIFLAVGAYWVSQLTGYQVAGEIDTQGYSNPLHKEVLARTGAWLFNYARQPATLAAPSLGFLGAAFALVMAGWSNRVSLFCSALSIAGIIATVGFGMFPFIVPSSSQLTSSLLVWDSSSSQLTLMVMLVAALIFVPIILLYTAWVYRVLRGKVKVE